MKIKILLLTTLALALSACSDSDGKSSPKAAKPTAEQEKAAKEAKCKESQKGSAYDPDVPSLYNTSRFKLGNEKIIVLPKVASKQSLGREVSYLFEAGQPIIAEGEIYGERDLFLERTSTNKMRCQMVVRSDLYIARTEAPELALPAGAYLLKQASTGFGGSFSDDGCAIPELGYANIGFEVMNAENPISPSLHGGGVQLFHMNGKRADAHLVLLRCEGMNPLMSDLIDALGGAINIRKLDDPKK